MTNRKPLLFIFLTVVIDMMGLGLIIPVMPDVLVAFTHDLRDASLYSGWLMFAYSITQFAFAPIIGGLSDRFGRKPVLILSLIGLGLDYVFTALAPSMVWLFVGRLIAGMCGASYTTASAYIADVSTGEDRAKNFGLIGAAWGLGFVLGPALGGLVSSFGVRAPFYAAAALALANSIFGIFFLPESLPPQSRRPFDLMRANPAGTLRQMLRYPALFGLFGAFFLLNLAGQVYPATWPFFTKSQLGWGPFEIGLSLAAFGLAGAGVQGLLTGSVIARLGEHAALRIGLLLETAAFVMFAFTTAGWVMFAIIVPASLSGIAQPAMHSLLSRDIPSSEQGELQGAITGLMSLTAIIGPVFHTSIFAWFSGAQGPVSFPGAAFIAAALLAFGAFVWAAAASASRQAARPAG